MYLDPEYIPVVLRQAVDVCGDSAYLLGWEQSSKSIITSLGGKMVIKEHLDVVHIRMAAGVRWMGLQTSIIQVFTVFFLPRPFLLYYSTFGNNDSL